MLVLIALTVCLAACAALSATPPHAPAWVDKVLGTLAVAPIAFLVFHGIAL